MLISSVVCMRRTRFSSSGEVGARAKIELTVLKVSARPKRPAIPSPEAKSGTKEAIAVK